MAEAAASREVSKQLYKDRPEWSDIKPIYHAPHEEAVIRIAMTEEFIDAFAYLRAVMQSNELTERAFELTTSCIHLNAANYSVWQFRRNIIKALLGDKISVDTLADEFEFCENATYENPKNYQVWHHRRVLVEWGNDPGKELAFTESMIQDDSKNYHAWQHRQWVVERFDLFGQPEMDFTVQLLLEDLRNNSAWNYRYFILSRTTDGFKRSEAVDNEIRFTMQCIKKIPSNESPWSYLTGILINEGLSTRKDVTEFCQELYADQNRSVHLRSFMVDRCLELIEKKEEAEKNGEFAVKLLEELKTIDPIRTKFWNYQALLVRNTLASQ
ncbi:Protein prenyltransferase alpha subunit repeat containing protein [Aphelenchoides avenae]|nr:Protein prenyltransferase alpha subunit repeat containing protein [Aphelenchus avenae]